MDAQDEFNWKQVGAAALTAGIIKGTPLGELASVTSDPLVNSVLQGALNSAVTQGVNIAVGLQDSFSWSAVAIASASTAASSVAGQWGYEQVRNVTDNAFLQQVGTNALAGAGSVLVRTAFGGKVDAISVLAEVFGNALGNSIVDRMRPIGLTEEQYADMNRQVEAGYLASQGQFNNQLQRDLRQQQFQLSLQRDIARSLSNNPEMFANLPVPRAEFDVPSVRPPVTVSTSPNAAGQSNFFEIMREDQRTGRTMEEVMLARELRAAGQSIRRNRTTRIGSNRHSEC